MPETINIVMLVDVIGALSDRSLLNDNLCMMDNGPSDSTGQGTTMLCTHCQPGQTINWVLYAVDLQTPAAIKSISFVGTGEGGSAGVVRQVDKQDDKSEQLDLLVWSAIVPDYMIPGVPYRYRLEIQMYEGSNSIMYVDTPSLLRI
jgi:hypothetical protein